jgi:hypothetical protein
MKTRLFGLGETFLVPSLANGLLLMLSWPAFKYFFFGEAFYYLQLYEEHHKHLWQAAFSQIGGIFFRPGIFLSTIWWNFILPPEPMAYHIRNAVLCCVNIFLLHRVLLKFVRSPWARAIALFLVAASKLYLTMIGRISLYEDSILLLTILLSILFWCRYIKNRRATDYILSLVFCTYSVYSKDHGFVILGVLAAIIVALGMKPDGSFRQVRNWLFRFAPFVVVAASYWVLRFILLGPINPYQAMYSPRLSLSVAAWQIQGFIATAGNFSLTQGQTMGAGGFSSLFMANSRAAEYSLCALLWLFIAGTVWRTRPPWRLWIVPAAWICLYIGPILLIRNHNVWYHQEPLAGLALLIGICLDRAGRPLLMTWSTVIALIAVNGYISNRHSQYDWEYVAIRSEIVKPIVASLKPSPPKAIVFVTTPEMKDFWEFAISGPLVPQMLGAPNTVISFVTSEGKVAPDTRIYRLPEQ